MTKGEIMIYLSGIEPSSIGPSQISIYAQAYIERYEKMVMDDENGRYLKNDTNIWIDDVMFDLVEHAPEKAFLVIDKVLLQTDNETVLCNLAAGPLESLLMGYGEEIMSQVEYRVKNSRKFRDLFSWMYPVTSEELWEKIVGLVMESSDRDM